MTTPPLPPPDLAPLQRTMVINKRRETRAWRETNDAEGHWVCDEQGPPGISIVVTPKGVALYGVPAVMRPSVARWVALRTAEAAGVYEAVFAGDGTIALEGGPSRPEVTPPMIHRAGAADIAPTVWWCSCGKSGTNSGGGTIHERNCTGTLTRAEETADA